MQTSSFDGIMRKGRKGVKLMTRFDVGGDRTDFYNIYSNGEIMGDKMNKKVVFFNLVNLLITFILAIIFGGAAQNIRGNELLLGSVTMVAVQLSPLITTLIFRKKYMEKALQI